MPETPEPGGSPTPLSDRLKAAIDQLDLDTKLARAEDAWQRSRGSVGEYTHKRRDDIERVLDTAAEKLNAGTDGRYADRVARLREGARSGLDRIEESRGDDDPPARD